MVVQADLFREEPGVSLTLDPKLDANMLAAWVRACDYCRGPGFDEVSVKLFTLGLLTANETKTMMQETFGVDVRAAREQLQLDDEPTGRYGSVKHRPTDDLRRVLYIACAESAARNGTTVSVADFVAALVQLPDVHVVAMLFPRHRARFAEQGDTKRIRRRLKSLGSRLAAIDKAVADPVRHHEVLASAGELKGAIGSIAAKLDVSPGLDLDADKVRGSFGNLHGRFDDIERRLEGLESRLTVVEARLGDWPSLMAHLGAMAASLETVRDEQRTLVAEWRSTIVAAPHAADRHTTGRGWFW